MERVLLIPMGVAPHREIDPEPGAEVRLEMARLAAGDDGLLEASDLEVAREGPSYTSRTLEWLHDERPGVDITLLMGADAAESLGSWREPERILELAAVGAARRVGSDAERGRAVVEGLGGRFESVEMPTLEVSSTEVRRRVAEGRSVRYLVPDAVRELIEERGLYR